MTYTELNFVVNDVKVALSFYQKIFEIQAVEQSDLEKGLNEVLFEMYNFKYHILDENPSYHLHARKNPEEPLPIWTNIIVEDINTIYQKVLNTKATIIQDLQVFEEYGVKNFMFLDPFGYTWLIHEVIKVVDMEEREKNIAEQYTHIEQ